MPKFTLACQVTVSAYTMVEAVDLDEAVKIAEGRDVWFANEAGGENNEAWLIEEADGAPQNIRPVQD